MREEILAIIKPTLELANQGVVQAVEVLKVQAPEVVNEILAWGFWINFIHFLFFALSLSFIIYLITGSRLKKLTVGDDGTIIKLIVSIFILFISSISSMPHFVFVWLKILIAPRLYLIEYVSSLIN